MLYTCVWYLSIPDLGGERRASGCPCVSAGGYVEIYEKKNENVGNLKNV